MILPIVLGVGCLITACTAAPAWADPAPVANLTDADKAVLAQLAETDWRQRQHAWRQLLQDQTMSDARLNRLYQAATSAEQRHRLLDVAQHHLLMRAYAELAVAKNEDGSLGVNFQPVAVDERPEVGQAAVLVLLTYPGFPAYAYLQPDDLIVAVAGRQPPPGLTTNQLTGWFKSQVTEHRAGDVIQLRLLRDDKLMEVTFPVAPHRLLTQMYEVEPRGLRRPLVLARSYRVAWRKRLAELASLHTDGEPLEVALPPVAH